jgi:prepilin-type N-terminal cleavage/methylation domain-containing protein
MLSSGKSGPDEVSRGVSTRHARVRAPQSGLTLLEMLVVMCIVGLIIGLTTPSISSGLDSVRLATATSSVAGFLNAAVTRVDRKQQPIEVLIEPSKNRIRIVSNEPGYTRDLNMPDGVIIESVLPEELYGDGAGDRAILLLPGATAPAIGVTLANRHGTKRLVQLDPMTGYPHIGKVGEK